MFITNTTKKFLTRNMDKKTKEIYKNKGVIFATLTRKPIRELRGYPHTFHILFKGNKMLYNELQNYTNKTRATKEVFDFYLYNSINDLEVKFQTEFA